MEDESRDSVFVEKASGSDRPEKESSSDTMTKNFQAYPFMTPFECELLRPTPIIEHDEGLKAESKASCSPSIWNSDLSSVTESNLNEVEEKIQEHDPVIKIAENDRELSYSEQRPMTPSSGNQYLEGELVQETGNGVDIEIK